MGAHALPDVVVVAFGKEMAIEIAHPLVAEGPGVMGDVFDAAALNPDLIAAAGVAGQLSFKHPGVMGCSHRLGGACADQFNPIGLRHPDPDHPLAVVERLWTQDSLGMVMAAFRKALTVFNHPLELSQHRTSRQSVAGSLSGFLLKKLQRVQQVFA
jgi:hypothetical protein